MQRLAAVVGAIVEGLPDKTRMDAWDLLIACH